MNSSKGETPKAQGPCLVTGDMTGVPMQTNAITEVTGIFNVQNFWNLGVREEMRLDSVRPRLSPNCLTHITELCCVPWWTLHGLYITRLFSFPVFPGDAFMAVDRVTAFF